MTSYKLYLDTRRLKKDGTAPLKIAVQHRGRFMIPIGISVPPENFIGDRVVLPPGAARRANSLNDIITRRLLSVETELHRLSLLGQLADMSDAQLRVILDRDHPLPADTEEPPTVLAFWETFIASRRAEGTKVVHRSTIAKVRQFCDIERLKFSDITVSWLKRFDKFMESAGIRLNTRSIHMRNIRAVMNAAINEDLIEQNLYPFRKFRIKEERTAKRSLTVTELRTLRDYPCEPFMEQYRDMFMLIFYLCGINAVDLFGLTEIHNGRIEYKRAKTGRLYSIKVEPEAMAIIEKYRGKTHLLNVAERYTNYKDYLHRLDDNLKKIGDIHLIPNSGSSGPMKKKYIGLYPRLSSYWARHSWATIAAELDIPKETIAAGLGHEIGSPTTSIYIDFNQKKVDEANRRIIDYLNGGGE